MTQYTLRLSTLVEASFPPGKWSSALTHFPPDNGFLVSHGSSIWHVSTDFKRSHWAGSLSGEVVRDGHRLKEAAFLDPTGIVIVGCDVYVIDRADNSIRKVYGDQVTTYACAKHMKRDQKVFVELSYPHHAVEHNGLLYVSNAGKHNIVVINLLENRLESIIGASTPTSNMKSSPSGAWASCTFDYPIGLAVNRLNNSIYVADASGNTIRELLVAEKKPGTVFKTSLNWVHGITCLVNGDIITCAYANSFLALFPHQPVPGVPYLELFGCIRPVAVCTTSSGDLAWLSEKGTLYVTRNLACLNESAPSINQNLILFTDKLLRPSLPLSGATPSSSISPPSEMEDIVTLFIKDQLKNLVDDPLLMVVGHALHGPLSSPYSEEVIRTSLISTAFDDLSQYRFELRCKMMGPAPLFFGIPLSTHRLPMNFKVHLPEMKVYSLLLPEKLIEDEENNQSSIEECKSYHQSSKGLISFIDSIAPGCRLLALGPYICELSAQQEMTMLYRSDMAINCLKKVRGQFLFTNQYSISSLDIKDRRSNIYAGSISRGRADGPRLTCARFEEIHQFVESESKLFISEDCSHGPSVLRILDLGSGMVSSIKCGFGIHDYTINRAKAGELEVDQQDTFLPCYLGLSRSKNVLYVGNRPHGGQIRLFHTKAGVLTKPIVPEALEIGEEDFSSPIDFGNGASLVLHPLSRKISFINSRMGTQQEYRHIDEPYQSMKIDGSELTLAALRSISVINSPDLGHPLLMQNIHHIGPNFGTIQSWIQKLDFRERASLAVSGFFAKAPTQFFRALNLCNMNKPHSPPQESCQISYMITVLFAVESASLQTTLSLSKSSLLENEGHLVVDKELSPIEIFRLQEFYEHYQRGFQLCSVHEPLPQYWVKFYQPYNSTIESSADSIESTTSTEHPFLALSAMPSYDNKLHLSDEIFSLPEALKAIGQNLRLRKRYKIDELPDCSSLPSSFPTFPVSFHNIPPHYVIDVHPGILTPQWPWFATFVTKQGEDRNTPLPVGFSVNLFVAIASAMYGNSLAEDYILHGDRIFIKANLQTVFQCPVMFEYDQVLPRLQAQV